MKADNFYNNRNEVNDGEDLWRRVYKDRTVEQIVPDGKGGFRPSSAVFKDKERKLSVDISSKTTIQKTIAGPPLADGVISFKADIPKSLGCRVVEDPILNDPVLPDNPAHALVIGELKPKDIRKIIIPNCHWVIEPPMADV